MRMTRNSISRSKITTHQLCVETVYNWFGQNSLASESGQDWGNYRQHPCSPATQSPITSVPMAGTDIKISESVKSLGVTIRSSLNFNIKACWWYLPFIWIPNMSSSTHSKIHWLWFCEVRHQLEPTLIIVTVSSRVLLKATSTSFNAYRTRWPV